MVKSHQEGEEEEEEEKKEKSNIGSQGCAAARSRQPKSCDVKKIKANLINLIAYLT